ncbi:unnamed protein product [Arctia plantaginis]|uniref:Uncharacterized protein n=1 Tax=Arctia plantaginis TaxID=874455 RepID=A0A8S0YSR3_ARCPL|nr:unnamed protein product [Arctia plantaginis]CAB3231976.1 unnamed protein product [Arctia plantaginis]
MILDEIHTEFNLNFTKIVATVTDNGSNFIKAFKEFGVSILNSDSFDLEEDDLDDEEDDLREIIDPRDFQLACHFRYSYSEFVCYYRC